MTLCFVTFIFGLDTVLCHLSPFWAIFQHDSEPACTITGTILFLYYFLMRYVKLSSEKKAYYKTAARIKKDTVGCYLGPADITEQLVSVQNSVMVPYSMLIWLKKSTAERKG